MNKFILYNKNLVKKASFLRKNMTPGEVLLWKHLRKKQLCDTDFNRQKRLINFIVDFYNCKHKLAIEIDGASHDESKYEYDRYRQKVLEREGVTFLRFTEYEVVHSICCVLATIEQWIENRRERKHPVTS